MGSGLIIGFIGCLVLITTKDYSSFQLSCHNTHKEQRTKIAKNKKFIGHKINVVERNSEQ
jgi:hypothetical protein